MSYTSNPNPRAHHPESQRNLMPIKTATAAITTDTTIVINDTEVDPSSTLYIWGVIAATSATEMVTCALTEHSGSTNYMKWGMHANSGFSWQATAPIAITLGKGVQIVNGAPANLAVQLETSVSIITVFYQIVAS